MVVDSDDRTLPKRPVLFDVGFHLSFIITLKNDLIIQFYNKYLLQKYLPVTHREELSVDRNQIMNLMQQIDFCMFLALLLDFFYNVDDVVEYPMEICLKVMKFTDQDRRPYRHQNISNVDGPLKDIVMMLLTLNMPFLTYEQTCLSGLLQQGERHRVPHHTSITEHRETVSQLYERANDALTKRVSCICGDTEENNVDISRTHLGRSHMLPDSVEMGNVKAGISRHLRPSNRPTIYYPPNLQEEKACEDPMITGYKKYIPHGQLGKGAQGQVVRMISTDGDQDYIAFKQMTSLDGFVMQLNALNASAKHGGHIKLIGIMRGTHPIEDFLDTIMDVNTKQGKFCYAMSLASGSTLEVPKNVDCFKDKANLEELRINYQIIILLLRQLQILHFSFNEYPSETHNQIYGAYSFTMSHGDLHKDNIIVQKQPDGSFTPVLIDMGFPLHTAFLDHNELFLQFYNKYLLDESLPKNDREGLVVNRHQIINSQQRYDFCMFIKLLITTFMGVTGLKGRKFTCASIFKWTKQHGDIIRYQPLSEWRADFVHLDGLVMLFQIFYASLLNYSDTWIKLVDYLSDFS
ncbi:hypothetical protein SNEBB_009062 [Seison nebaliae]|nr:hypothetical protein SNEBB_009062 [Seison nebaliae]